MEIISNKILLLFSRCMKMEKGSWKLMRMARLWGRISTRISFTVFSLIITLTPETISDLIIVAVYPH